MTRLMKQAIAKLQTVPESEQDQIAELVLSELEESARWIQSTAAHEEKLKRLVEQVISDDAAGQCPRLEPDRL